MRTSKTKKQAKDSRKLITEELDLEPIMVKAMDKEEGYGWNLKFTKEVAKEYRRYLVLTIENPGVPVVPSNYVDDFWHLHILDTMKYAEDCNKYLGSFLHHFPYFGMRGKEDAENLLSTWLETRKLYENTFGAIPESTWPISNRCPNCGRRCRDPLGVHPDVYQDARPRLADMKKEQQFEDLRDRLFGALES